MSFDRITVLVIVVSIVVHAVLLQVTSLVLAKRGLRPPPILWNTQQYAFWIYVFRASRKHRSWLLLTSALVACSLHATAYCAFLLLLARLVWSFV